MITFIKKAASILSIGLLIGSSTSQAKMVPFDTVLKNHAGKNYQRALTDAIEQAGNVVVYVGADWCKYCKTTMDAIRKLITEFPDVVFIIINSDKYPSFKSGTIPKLKFYVNGVYITVTGSQNLAQLRASLKKYYLNTNNSGTRVSD